MALKKVIATVKLDSKYQLISLVYSIDGGHNKSVGSNPGGEGKRIWLDCQESHPNEEVHEGGVITRKYEFMIP